MIHGAFALSPLLFSAALESMWECRGEIVFMSVVALNQPYFKKSKPVTNFGI